MQLPATDAIRMFLVDTLRAQIDALVKFQDPESGLWHTLLDDRTSYLEASASAGFVYGILKVSLAKFSGDERDLLTENHRHCGYA